MNDQMHLRFLAAGHFLDHYFLLIFPTAVIAIERDWALGYGAALALGTPVYLAFAAGTLPAGWLGDRFRRDHLISVQFLGCGLASVCAALAPGATWLMVSLGVMGLFASIYHPVGLAFLTDLTERPGRALAVNGVFGNLGLAGAALVTGLLAAEFGWRSAFLVPGVASVALGVWYLALCLGKPAAGRAGQLRGRVAAFEVSRSVQVRVLAVVATAALFGGVVFNGVSVSLPKLFEERLLMLDGSLSAVGAYTALVFAVAAFAQLPVGGLLDRHGAKPVLIPLLALQLVFLAVVSQTGGFPLIPISAALVLLVFAGIPITGWLLAHYVSSTARARVFAIEYLLSLGVGASVVPMIAAVSVAGGGFDLIYLVFAGCIGIVLALSSILPPARSAGSAKALAPENPPAA